MDHEVVVRQKMTERYLLNELDSESRDEFEEHTKNVLAEAREPETAPAAIPTPAPASSGWLAWLRPAFLVSVLALLVAVVGYQNLVTFPRLQQALNRPQVLPWAPVNVGTWGSGGPVITASPGQGFLLFVRIPPEGSYSDAVDVGHGRHERVRSDHGGSRSRAGFDRAPKRARTQA